MDFFYPPDLPISAFKDDISKLIVQHQVIIIAGDTGSGKTTQLPKICMQTCADIQTMIGCTQPRRIAATSVTDRVRQEMGQQAELVASKIRFSDRTTPATRIKFMTDGILLAEIKQDPLLTKYGVLIVDEAHERSLNIDFLLGYLHRLLPRRPDLKLIITSATIDTELFSNHFGGAPVFNIPGRSYPVEILYRPAEGDIDEITYLEHCVDMVDDVARSQPPGDMLVFLPTERDIRGAHEMLQGRLPGHLILPLFGRLQAKDQRRIFSQHQSTKIILATNVAETSITVPGIRYVIDTGLARISSYHARSHTTRLPVTRISQASCNQRSGRCGRVGPGTCYRLFAAEDYEDRVEFSVPEIQRANLADVILQMSLLDLGKVELFPFINIPKPAAIRDGYRTLFDLGALDEDRQLTRYGRTMAKLPIDPVIARIIIEAENEKCTSEIMVIAAALAIADPRVRPAEREQQADQAHQSFSHPGSDFCALLNIWNSFTREHNVFSWSKLRRFCSQYFLSFQRMREWFDLHDQLHRLLRKRRSFTLNDQPASFDNIHRALLCGLFRQCARRKEGLVYQNVSNMEIMVFPGSHQYRKSGDLILAGSLLETSRLYALTVATIEPEWVEQAAGQFCSYSWSRPRWQKKTGRVIADESVSLQGLPLLSKRIVNFGNRNKKNIPEARSIFIQQGLVEGLLAEPSGFIRQNQSLLGQWREKEDQLRKRSLAIDDMALFDFYDKRLPAHVYDRSTLIKYIKKRTNKRLLLAEQDIVINKPADAEFLNYPSNLMQGAISLELSYCFEPGSERDGVTVYVPELVSSAIDPDIFDWLVPGLILEKTIFMLKGLPKKIRKRVIPLQNTAERILDSVDYGSGNYLKTLSSALFKFFRLHVSRADWPDSLPNHLTMYFVITNEHGKEINSGNNFRELETRLANPVERIDTAMLSESNQRLINGLADQSYRSWDFLDAPARIPVYLRENKISGYLHGALRPSDDRQSVSIVYLNSHLRACEINLSGTYVLLQNHFKTHLKELKKYLRLILSGPSTFWLTSALGGTHKVTESLVRLVMRTIFGDSFPHIITRDEFDKLLEIGKNENITVRGKEIADRIIQLVRLRKEIQDLINKFRRQSGLNRISSELYDDLEHRLEAILPPDFLDHLEFSEHTHLVRYLKSLAIRTERAYSNPAKDKKKSDKLRVHQDRLRSYREQKNMSDGECADLYRRYKFLFDEMHVSLFSPELKTAAVVSEKKLAESWKLLQQSC